MPVYNFNAEKKCERCGEVFPTFKTSKFKYCRTCYKALKREKDAGLREEARLATFSDHVTKCGGWVYFLIADNGLVKIGKTEQDPDIRAGQIRSMSPVEVYPWAYIPFQFGFDLERYFHDLFAERRVKGEWFALEEMDFEIVLTLFFPNKSLEGEP